MARNLTMLATLYGVPVMNGQQPKSFYHVQDCDIFGDKGFIGLAWQKMIHEQAGKYQHYDQLGTNILVWSEVTFASVVTRKLLLLDQRYSALKHDE